MLIAIDGACKRNGKPDCTSAGGVFLRADNGESSIKQEYEYNSTNQRGELLALCVALDCANNTQEQVNIVTDSEYIFNTITKQWYERWEHSGWLSASGEEVKNKDLWQRIIGLLQREVHMFHIKGHCMSIGKVTGGYLLEGDSTGSSLYTFIRDVYDKACLTKASLLEKAQNLSEKNNGFVLRHDILKDFVTMNTMADIIATNAVEKAEVIRNGYQNLE